MLLQVEDLKVSYGQVKALLGVSIEIEKGEIVSIIGANGAGKSTLMKSIMGDVKSQSGKIFYNGTLINRAYTHRIVKDGIVYVPEGRQVFTRLNVQENLEMGAYCRSYSRAEINALYEECYQMFPILKKRRRQLAGSLSGGEQQMLALCRGLMSSPVLMLLDEPSLGLAPIIVEEVFSIIDRINRDKGISIILVEQNAYMALETSSRCYVLENGLVSLSGESSVLINDSKVKAAYLGK
jgi:branched-chain amino acid transport system ATP-binding protein